MNLICRLKINTNNNLKGRQSECVLNADVSLADSFGNRIEALVYIERRVFVDHMRYLNLLRTK